MYGEERSAHGCEKDKKRQREQNSIRKRRKQPSQKLREKTEDADTVRYRAIDDPTAHKSNTTICFLFLFFLIIIMNHGAPA